MGSVNNALLMLAYLSTGRQYTIRELAGLLEVSEKSVRLYREALDSAGIYVQETRGRYGGYRIPREYYQPPAVFSLTDGELLALEILEGELTGAGHVEASSIRGVLTKLKAVREMNRMEEEPYGLHLAHMAGGVRPNTDPVLEREKFLTLVGARKKRRKVKMAYRPLNRPASERVVHVYHTYTYQGEMYMAAWCELRKEIRDFKIRRAEKLEILDQTYEIPAEFNMKEYMQNCIGVFRGEPYLVHLRVEEPMSRIIREKVWSDQQSIREIPGENAIEFEAVMRGKQEILSWILGMGSQVEVLAPESLRREYLEECRKMLARAERQQQEKIPE